MVTKHLMTSSVMEEMPLPRPFKSTWSPSNLVKKMSWMMGFPVDSLRKAWICASILSNDIRTGVSRLSPERVMYPWPVMLMPSTPTDTSAKSSPDLVSGPRKASLVRWRTDSPFTVVFSRVKDPVVEKKVMITGYRFQDEISDTSFFRFYKESHMTISYRVFSSK